MVVSGIAIGNAVSAWIWFATASEEPAGRFCGNCFLGSVGISTELGVMGLIAIAAVPFRGESSSSWGLALCGVVLTPIVLGVPVFSLVMLGLALSTRIVREVETMKA